MTRFPDWQSRLETFLAGNSRRRFQYGEWDCVSWVCSAIEVMTGVDPQAQWRGSYRNRTEAFKVAWDVAHSTSLRPLVEKVAADLSLREIPPAFAQRGDIALVRRPSDYSLGMVALDGVHLIVAGDRALQKVPRLLARQAWAI